MRHPLGLRIQHAVNALAMLLLLMSGLGIFNAHPALYLGNDARPLREILRIGAIEDGFGGLTGNLAVLGHQWNTSGWIGASVDEAGQTTARGFPAWSTLPGPNGLAKSREWHFLGAWLLVINGLIYLTISAINGHLRHELWFKFRDWRGIGTSILDHLRFRHARGEQALRYNVLQKAAYLAVILLLGPGMLLTGLAMSPAMNALIPGWVDLLGGRQSARTLHFLLAAGLVTFVLVHLFQVLASGRPINYLRSIVTGRFEVPPDSP